jgi:hypothetical protein
LGARIMKPAASASHFMLIPPEQTPLRAYADAA